MQRTDLHIDIETYSSVDIKSCGAYKYVESPDFEILLIAYAVGTSPVEVIDIASGEEIPQDFILALQDPRFVKWAHNATFERIAFRRIGIDTAIDQWRCSAILAGYCGYPLSLAGASKAMQLQEKGKLSTGKALIRYFCQPVKATKANGGRTRNYPHHNPEKWSQFIEYNINDVVAEREITRRLKDVRVPAAVWRDYVIDQEINDEGILIDTDIASNAVNIDERFSAAVREEVKKLTGVENPGSVAQLKEWLSEALGREIDSLAKGDIPGLVEEAGVNSTAAEVLRCRQRLAKSSVKKYMAMLNCVCADGRAHGLFQYYGASRTGRWAGRLIQLQNLPQNHLPDLSTARDLVKHNEYSTLEWMYGNVPGTLSELIRTALIAPEGKTFAVADFSAIEARVLSWLAGEKWRNDVFASHGKIYEASAAMMFNVPIESIAKGSDLRQRGKVAELALGYQGAVHALEAMGGAKMGLSQTEMQHIVQRWRKANPKIVRFWYDIDKAAKATLKDGCWYKVKCIGIRYKDGALRIQLPSGRELFYQNAKIGQNRYGNESVVYMGVNDKKQWGKLETYGGKFTENIVQAIARDLLAESIYRLRAEGFQTSMHVHDEVVCEVEGKIGLDKICQIMESSVTWAPGLLLRADGYTTDFYLKD